MRYLFEISKEHISLPKSEIFACLESEEYNYKLIESNEDLIIIETDVVKQKIEKLSKRLSNSFYVSEFLFSSKPQKENIKIIAKNYLIKESGSIAVKYKNRSKQIKSKEIVSAIAEIYTKNRQVSLEKSDVEIRALITDNKIYVGNKIAKIDRTQYEQRKVQNRPFFSPISLHPKLARTIVNLTSIKSGETLFDPFCGTGGILIEAGLIGAKVFGSDIEEKMIIGCKKNLEYYGINNYKLFNKDIGEIVTYIKKMDAIATDFPYGKSTTTKGEKIIDLYERSFSTISQILKDGGKAVVGISNKDYLDIGNNYLSIFEIHQVRVHGSLTRYFGVYKK
jgi:tRNA (guanine10-N2)-dimethyltransferase